MRIFWKQNEWRWEPHNGCNKKIWWIDKGIVGFLIAQKSKPIIKLIQSNKFEGGVKTTKSESLSKFA